MDSKVQYDNPISTGFLAPIECLKLPKRLKLPILYSLSMNMVHRSFYLDIASQH